jgi:hypothetical protein
VSRHPHLGVPKSKPRLPRVEPNDEPASKEEVAKLSREYLIVRNAQMRGKAFMAETEAAQKRGELILKSLVERQAAFIFASLRQAILNFPSRYARHILGLSDERQAKEVLTKAAYEFLDELSGFPEKCVNPDWLETLEGDSEETPSEPPQVRPASGPELKAEQAKAKARRESKTETMRQLRAKH